MPLGPRPRGFTSRYSNGCVVGVVCSIRFANNRQAPQITVRGDAPRRGGWVALPAKVLLQCKKSPPRGPPAGGVGEVGIGIRRGQFPSAGRPPGGEGEAAPAVLANSQSERLYVGAMKVAMIVVGIAPVLCVGVYFASPSACLSLSQLESRRWSCGWCQC